MKKYLILLLLLIPSLSFAADIDCDSTTLQAAIDSASDGDTITCKAGSFAWTASPNIPATKGLIITGKGTATETGTLITHAAKPLIINLADANSTVDISGFKITKTATGSSIILYNSNNPPVYAGDPMFRIHGNYFEDGLTTNSAGTISIANYAYGLIDNNTFNDFGSYGIFTNFQITGEAQSAVEGAWSWSQAQSVGTNKAVYIENNTFATTRGASTIAISGSSGARYVARHNDITGTSISSHSGCTGGRYQPMWLEAYSNKIDYNAWYGLLWYRSNSGIMWANSFPLSASSTVMRVDFERSYRADCNTTYTTINTTCNGTQAIDGNTAEMNGWPCMGQPGYGPLQTTITDGDVTDNGMDLGYVFSGLFAWANTRGASTAINLGYNGSYATQEAHMAFGRELYNTAHMTIGGAKPETCTAATGTSGRDIYIDTTTAASPVIWQCSATNTWTQHWTPYTCPHPLAGAGECTTAAGTGGYLLGGSPPIYTATSSVVNAAGGSVSGSQSVESGSTTTFTYEVFNGWKFKAWAGTCGGSGTTTYTTNAISADCTVTAEFEQITLNTFCR